MPGAMTLLAPKGNVLLFSGPFHYGNPLSLLSCSVVCVSRQVPCLGSVMLTTWVVWDLELYFVSEPRIRIFPWTGLESLKTDFTYSKHIWRLAPLLNELGIFRINGR